ncbi:MAG: exodeoxyribonuclease VII small subunit [Candidatus Xenobium sp.]|jgi:exodeoxyribonuclease VII small subunit|nr:exodeoxyribonuclease VII small subunit [Burkholderiales bacterium]
MTDPEPSYEESIERLRSVVELLEDGNLGLEESLHLFEDGMHLLRRCEERLRVVEEQVRILTESPDPKP